MILIALGLNNCRNDEPKIVKEKVTGQVQKGPYVNGTSIVMSELNSSMSQTGNVFTTEINNNIGSFEIDNISLSSPYVEFSANGYYFDEVNGEVSSAPLNLYALSDIDDISTVNVNILTHLEKKRVDYLISQGKTFSEAKATAQKEIFAIFGFSTNAVNNSEALDISSGGEDNAMLLAISVIMQGNRSVGDLTELLANISSDIKEDGTLNSSTILTDLRNSTKVLDLTAIRSNLEKRFQNLGVSATISDFETYINRFIEFTGGKPGITIQSITDTTTTSATLNGMVVADYMSTNVSFEYGETVDYGKTVDAAQNPVKEVYSQTISAPVSDLLPGKTYHLRAKAENVNGIIYSRDTTFTTQGKVPDVVAGNATNIKVTEAVLNGTVNPNYLSTNITFEWGLTTNYGNTIPAKESPVTGSVPVNISADLSGLEAGTTYHYRIKAENSLGITYSNDIEFTTLGKGPYAVAGNATNILMTGAVLNGTVNPNSLSTTVEFEWGETINYGNTISANESPVEGDFPVNVSVVLTELLPGTTYHFRVKASNQLGTTISDDISFTSLTPITDFDGNVYNPKTIGTQLWLIENLKTTRYNNGDLIGTTTPATMDVSGENNPKYQWAYDGDESYVASYGRLYTWYAINDTRNVCPTGWHVPTVTDWDILTSYLGGSLVAGGKMKEAGFEHWVTNTSGSNSSGFTALPGGRRLGSDFGNLNTDAFFWSASEYSIENSWSVSIYSTGAVLTKAEMYEKNAGFSVRCIKD